MCAVAPSPGVIELALRDLLEAGDDCRRVLRLPGKPKPRSKVRSLSTFVSAAMASRLSNAERQLRRLLAVGLVF